MLLEICLDSATSARQLSRDLQAIQAGGAGRVELCRNAAVGGLSPAPTALRLARRQLGPAVELLVLVRPRAGDFVYNRSELAVMRREILQAADLGAQGVVLGALRQATQDVEIDRHSLEEWAGLCHRLGLTMTFHRAFDELDRPAEGLERLILAGVARVLSAGRPGRYGESMPVTAPGPPDGKRLVRLLEQARGRIELVAGGGLGLDTAPALARCLARTGGRFSLHSRGAVLEGGRVSRTRVARMVRITG